MDGLAKHVGEREEIEMTGAVDTFVRPVVQKVSGTSAQWVQTV